MSLWEGQASLSHELRFLEPSGRTGAGMGEKLKCTGAEGVSKWKRGRCFMLPGEGCRRMGAI